MSTAVLISIRPKWCELIASGKKTIEVRKTAPKLETPFKCYIYCTKDEPLLYCRPSQRIGNGRVLGEFVCDYTQTIYFDSDVRHGIDHPNDYGKWLMDASGVTLWEMFDYLDGKDGVYWHISNLVIYDAPKPLSVFHRPCPGSLYCESCAMWSERRGCGNAALQITRPPQSWCYVEEVN